MDRRDFTPTDEPLVDQICRIAVDHGRMDAEEAREQAELFVEELRRHGCRDVIEINSAYGEDEEEDVLVYAISTLWEQEGGERKTGALAFSNRPLTTIAERAVGRADV